MPLLDHFHRPSDRDYPWRTLYTLWCARLMGSLNTRLPEGYRALTTTHFGGQATIDMTTVDQSDVEETEAAPRPPVVRWASFPDMDWLEVEVLSEASGERLAAAIELVSPRNKDRPVARRAFAARVAAYLQRGIGVVVVDIVTDRGNNLHAELMELLELGEEAAGAFNLYAVAYRAVADGKRSRLEIWPTALEFGSPLPTLPLWIGPELAVPVDLEGTYTVALQAFRVR